MFQTLLRACLGVSLVLLTLAVAPKSQAESAALQSELAGLAEIDTEDFYKWPDLQLSIYYYALTKIDKAILANPQDPLALAWLSNGVLIAQDGRIVNAQQALQVRASDNFRSGKMMRTEYAYLFEWLLGRPLNLPEFAFGGCLAHSAILREISTKDQTNSSFYNAYRVAAYIAQLDRAAEYSHQRAVRSPHGEMKDSFFVQRLKSGILYDALFSGGFERFDAAIYAANYPDALTGERIPEAKVKEIASTLDPRLKEQIAKAQPYIAAYAKASDMPPDQAVEWVCGLLAAG